MKQIKQYIILLLTVPFLLVACYDDPGTEIVWTEGSYLEIDRAGQPNPAINVSLERTEPGLTETRDIQINIMGLALEGATTVNFEVDESSTAVEGLQFNFPNGNSITIPAGEHIGFLTVEFDIDASLTGDDEDPYFLVLSISESSSLPLSKYTELRMNLLVLCPSDLTGDYDFFTDANHDFGNQTYEGQISLGRVEGTPNQYIIPDFTGGVWGSPPYSTTYGTSARVSTLYEICGAVIIDDVPNQFGGTITTTAGGLNPPALDEDTGVIEWEWLDLQFGENGVVTYTPVD